MPARGAHAAARVCQICTLCSGAHGAELYRRLFGALNTGAMSPYVALAAVALDDAWLTGNATIDKGGTFVVEATPRRWQVVLAHAKLANTTPSLELVMQAALAPFMGLHAVPNVIDDAKREMRAALLAAAPGMFDMEIKLRFDKEQGLVFEIQTKIATNPEVLQDAKEDVPDYVFSGPRGSA